MNQTSYPYEVKIEVAFRDIDALGHVNNAVFFSYMEYVRLKYVTGLFAGTALAAESLLDIPLILAEATCSYRSPALFGETIILGVGVSRFGNKSFDLSYRFEGSNGRVIALGKTIQVMYDYSTSRAFPIPAEIKSKINTYQRDWQLPKNQAVS